MLVAASEVPGQSPARSFEVSGVVLDPSGAVIADAKVILRRDGGRSPETKTANQRGEFHFTRIASGDYEIEVRKDGFKPAVTHFTVGAKSPSPLEIVLPIADVREEIAVADRPDQTNTDPDENLNVIKLNHETLSNLPVLGNDVIGSVANLLDAGSIGSDGPTIIVDGLETSRTKVPASTIQEVRINQNPYSAEFARLGRARIEVFTKPGSSQYHGEFNFLFRDHLLDARNAFALERPPEQRRFYEGNVSGPLGNGKTTSFLLSVNREEEDLQSVVFASTPAGLVSENVSNPNRDTEISFRIWSRADFDERHRFNLLGTIKAGEWFNLGMTLALTSGRPYSLTTGRDDNHDNLANDRPPGVPRNSLQGPGAATLDVRWAKEFRLKQTKKKDGEGPSITIGVAAFNVLNRTNFAGFVGNLSSPFFGLPVASRPARRTQLTLGFKF